MIVAVLMRNSRPFTARQYIAAILLCVGTAGFSWGQGKDGTTAHYVALGIIFLGVSVLCDAFSANFQQHLLQRLGVPPMVMMFRLNMCGILVSAATIVGSGYSSDALSLLERQPDAFAYVAAVGACLSVGVWANTRLLLEAGAVLMVSVATLRKVMTIILSYCIFKKEIQTSHVLCALVVLLGLVIAEIESIRGRAQAEKAVTKAGDGTFERTA
eukprot:TRINITY_DN2180_c0_g2_i1.p2 TRINITY_DN2180_c0_g2~~TRINITY_DN2180_c0_g2_i1.p2  ORF type:complete len:214 (-),score=32.08 TRINITY_DN2180_c0_g2_i1:120-761(-)